jgi:putative endonuclease
MRGFKILEKNWRRPNCEIDIIAYKDAAIHFIEVKYRKDDNQGGGIEAINQTKLKKMRQGAWTWVEENKYHGQHVLSAIELMGKNYTVMSFIENVY